MPAGIGWNARSGATAYSANAPPPKAYRSAKTWSPGLKRVALGPTASTTPATSMPRRGFLGARTPMISRTNCGRGSIPSRSARLMDAARTLTRTWSSVGRRALDLEELDNLVGRPVPEESGGFHERAAFTMPR